MNKTRGVFFFCLKRRHFGSPGIGCYCFFLFLSFFRLLLLNNLWRALLAILCWPTPAKSRCCKRRPPMVKRGWRVTLPNRVCWIRVTEIVRASTIRRRLSIHQVVFIATPVCALLRKRENNPSDEIFFLIFLVLLSSVEAVLKQPSTLNYIAAVAGVYVYPLSFEVAELFIKTTNSPHTFQNVITTSWGIAGQISHFPLQEPLQNVRAFAFFLLLLHTNQIVCLFSLGNCVKICVFRSGCIWWRFRSTVGKEKTENKTKKFVNNRFVVLQVFPTKWRVANRLQRNLRFQRRYQRKTLSPTKPTTKKNQQRPQQRRRRRTPNQRILKLLLETALVLKRQPKARLIYTFLRRRTMLLVCGGLLFCWLALLYV